MVYTRLLFTFFLLGIGMLYAQLPNPLNYNTASNATNTGTISLGANDLHWSAAINNSITGYVPAVSCGNQAVCCWTNASNGLSNWITYPHTCSSSPAEHSCLGNIDVYYKLNLNLPAFICGNMAISTPSVYCLSMNFFADNCVYEIFVNGIINYQSSTSIPYSYSGFTSGGNVNINLCNNWQAGTNTLIVHVKSGAPGYPGWEGFLAVVNPTLTTALTNTISANVTVLNNQCFGASAGAASISVLPTYAPYTYSWIPNVSSASIASGLSAGNYTYMVIGPNVCGTASVISITQPPALSLNIVASSPSACVGNSIQLSANGSGGTAPYAYAWSNGPTNANYNTTQTNAGNYIYTLSTTDANNCVLTKTTTLNFITNPNISISGSNSLCVGQTIVLTVSGATSYAWSNGNFTPSTSVNPTTTTNYTVIGTSANGCVNSMVKTIQVFPLPSLNLSTKPPVICAGESMTLSANGAGTYSWNNGAQTPSIIISPTVNTTYSVKGTLNTCTNSAVTTVTVNKCSGLNELNNQNFALNVFPNPCHDILNIVLGEGNFKLSVFNAEGILIFETELIDTTYQLNTSNFASGLYLVHCYKEGMNYIKRIVKE